MKSSLIRGGGGKDAEGTGDDLYGAEVDEGLPEGGVGGLEEDEEEAPPHQGDEVAVPLPLLDHLWEGGWGGGWDPVPASLKRVETGSKTFPVPGVTRGLGVVLGVVLVLGATRPRGGGPVMGGGL